MISMAMNTIQLWGLQQCSPFAFIMEKGEGEQAFYVAVLFLLSGPHVLFMELQQLLPRQAKKRGALCRIVELLICNCVKYF